MNYCLESRGKSGTVVVATKDMLPGNLVMMEYPLMHLSLDFLNRFNSVMGNERYNCILAAYVAFRKQLSSEQQAKYLSLYNSMDSDLMEKSRNLARRIPVVPGITDSKEFQSLSDAEVEIFAKVVGVFKLNHITFTDSGKAIYENSSKLSQSCIPNCGFQFDGVQLYCRTISPIKTGDVLTCDFFSSSSILFEPIHVRRSLYVVCKEITCHCARCDNPADDTRQFSCFDVNCTGQHYACQPIYKEDNEILYTGVKYVEPHLLPCTVCNRTPPAEYQQHMFELEANLPNQTTMMKSLKSEDEFHSMCDNLMIMYVPPFHTVSNGILFFRFAHRISEAPYTLDYQTLMQAGLAMVRPYERMALCPNRRTCVIFNDAATRAFLPSFKLGAIPEALGLALEYSRKALRMFLIMHGREQTPSTSTEMKMKEKYSPVIESLELLERTGNSTDNAGSRCCIVCGENPECASFALSKCSKCLLVHYCSVGCQRAHWKLHKKKCCA